MSILPILGAVETSPSGVNTGDLSLAAVGSAPAAAGASLAGQVLTLQPADATRPGVVTAGTQTIGGNKTFSGSTTFGGALSLGNNGVTTTGSINAGVGGFLGDFLRRYNSATMDISGGTTADNASSVGVSAGSAVTYAAAGAKLLSVRNNGTEKAFVDKDGKLGFLYTDGSGTPGAVTISKPTGRAAIASGASSVVVTNTLVSAASVVMVQLETSGIGVGEISVSPGAGSFTVTSINALGVATNVTGAATFSFVVFN